MAFGKQLNIKSRISFRQFVMLSNLLKNKIVSIKFVRLLK